MPGRVSPFFLVTRRVMGSGEASPLSVPSDPPPVSFVGVPMSSSSRNGWTRGDAESRDAERPSVLVAFFPLKPKRRAEGACAAVYSPKLFRQLFLLFALSLFFSSPSMLGLDILELSCFIKDLLFPNFQTTRRALLYSPWIWNISNLFWRDGLPGCDRRRCLLR